MPPADFYMGNYMLDGCVAADMHTAYGYYRDAARQLLSFKDVQRPDGRVPGVTHPPKRWSINPERWLSTNPFDGNDYPQSPVWAYSVLQLVERANSKPAVSPQQNINPDVLLAELYPNLRPFYMFLAEKCAVAKDDPRVFLLHPHQDNRDSDPSKDKWKEDAIERQLGKVARKFLRRRPRTHENMPARLNYHNTVMDYLGALATNLDGYQANWEPARIHEISEYVDVWYNFLLYENYLAMAELAARLDLDEDAVMFYDLATDLGLAMDRHYDPQARSDEEGYIGAYYAIYNGQPQRVDTVGNLIAPLRRDLPADHLRSNHRLLRSAFEAPYMISCVAIDQMDDPHHEETNRHWRNGIWGVANAIYMRGQLVQQNRTDLPEDLKLASREIFEEVHEDNLEMVDNTGDYAEHYSHITGKGHRLHKAAGHAFGTPAHYPWEQAYVSFGY